MFRDKAAYFDVHANWTDEVADGKPEWLKNLLDIRVKARGPLNETSERLYVSLDELLSTAQANAVEGIAPAQGITRAQPNTGLW